MEVCVLMAERGEWRKHRQMVHLNVCVCVCITCLCCSAEPPPSGPLVFLIRLSSPVGPVGPDGGEFILFYFFNVPIGAEDSFWDISSTLSVVNWYCTCPWKVSWIPDMVWAVFSQKCSRVVCHDGTAM